LYAEEARLKEAGQAGYVLCPQLALAFTDWLM
jgi:hypothetical protein